MAKERSRHDTLLVPPSCRLRGGGLLHTRLAPCEAVTDTGTHGDTEGRGGGAHSRGEEAPRG